MLVGREHDTGRFADFLADLPGVGGVLVLVGEPGVGKTALLAEVSRTGEATGLQVLRSAGAPYRVQVGYGGLRQLVTSTPECRAAAASSPELAAVLGLERGAAPAQEDVTRAVLSLVASLASTRPTLMVLDDAQWLDGASAVVLGQVARRLPGPGTGMVCAVRPAEEGFFDYDGLPLHELRPLGEAASEELLVRHFPALAPRVRRRLMAEAEGNPLALLELPTTLTDAQQDASRALPARLPLTQRLQAAFASRIRGLPAVTRHLLLVAALEGTGNLLVLRRAVAGRCDLKHLAPAERGQLVRVDETRSRLEFRHPLVRSAVVDLSTGDQRRRVHRWLAQAWEAVPEQRVRHLAHAAVAPDERIAALLEESADDGARRGDGPNAVAALVRAADLSPSGAERARRLAKAAYVGASLTGDLREVPTLLDTARQTAPDPASPAAAVATAMYLLNSYGDIDTAHRLLHGAISLQPEPYDLIDATLSEAMSTLLMVCVHSGRGELWAGFDQLLAQCVKVPDTLQLLRATFADPARARPADWARLDAAIDALPGTADPVRIVRIATAGAYADRLGAVDEQLRHTARGGSTGENGFTAIQASFLWGSHAWFTGQWPELRRVVGRGLDLCDELQYPLRSWTGKYLLACVSAVCADFTAAGRLVDQMDQWAGSRRGHAVRCYAAHARTLIALSRGDFETAYRHACVISPAGSFAPFAGHAVWAVLDLVEAAVRSGRRDEALAHVAAARDAGLAAVSPRLDMVVHACTALAAGDDREATAAFGRALAVEGAERWPFDLARVHLFHGERLRRARASARARHHLETAADAFRRLGAAPWAERAARELRATGRHRPAGPQGSGVALTPQQRHIAQLAASGLTNREIGEQLFLSPRTVSTHLHQLFPKLGVTSRAALRDALDRLEAPGPDYVG